LQPCPCGGLRVRWPVRVVCGAWGVGGVQWIVQSINNKKPARGGRGVLCAGVVYFAWVGGVV